MVIYIYVIYLFIKYVAKLLKTKKIVMWHFVFCIMFRDKFIDLSFQLLVRNIYLNFVNYLIPFGLNGLWSLFHQRFKFLNLILYANNDTYI